MHIKLDFVTNSSSSSFIISKDKLTDLQIFLIKHHIEAYELYSKTSIDHSDKWIITECDKSIEGTTSMDNFSMRRFFKIIGVPEDDIESDEGAF